jgi:hypothetical protein
MEPDFLKMQQQVQELNECALFHRAIRSVLSASASTVTLVEQNMGIHM